MTRRLMTAGTLVAASLLALTTLTAVPAATAAPPGPDDLASRVEVEDVMTHLHALDDIAAANGGNRAAGTEGYEKSAQYVESVLEGAGYDPVRQDFSTPVQTIREQSVVVTGGTPAVDAIAMNFTPGTDADGVTGILVSPTNVNGCTVEDWDGVMASGGIALVSRGDCSFVDKSLAAGAVGATGIIVYNNEEDADAPLLGTLGAPDPDFVPSFGVSRAEGAALLAASEQEPVEVTLVVDETTRILNSFNVIAETSGGRADNVVMLGAHLDSVPEGPGINDNGSGSAAVLQTAVELAGSAPTNNRVRFAWWGAEEEGLHGSTAYVESLEEAEADDIAAYLNLDMIGSPNYMIGVYDADESTHASDVDIPAGSEAIEDVFTDYFDAQDQPWIDSAFDGRSDYQGFIDAGIPSGGLFTGAEDEKTADEAELFGGTAGAWYDPNYHLSGDDVDNVSEEALAITVPAVAHATAALAEDTSAVNGVKRPSTTTLRLSRSTTTYRGRHATAVATVTGASSGSVRFLDNGRQIGKAQLSGGRATLPLDGVWSVGRHTITARFVGSTSVAASASTARLQVVKASLSSLRLTGPPYVAGTRPVVHVHVGPLKHGGRPTGTVRISVDGRAVARVPVQTSSRTIRVLLPRQEDRVVRVRAAFGSTSSIWGASDEILVRPRP